MQKEIWQVLFDVYRQHGDLSRMLIDYGSIGVLLSEFWWGI
jgi:hypothetical protein